ncbi:MAG: 30S ribosome-binding factor RbfA [Alphaproteobacteria bacterium]
MPRSSKPKFPNARSSAPGQRQLRVGELIRHALVDILARASFRDPELASARVTITVVKMSQDLRHATVFIVPFGTGDAEVPERAFNRAAPFIRHELAKEIELRFLPELHFKADESFGHASRIDALLRRPEIARDLAATPDSWAEGAEDDYSRETGSGESKSEAQVENPLPLSGAPPNPASLNRRRKR